MVFEGAFEKIFIIIQDEGGAEGGVVVEVVFCDLFARYIFPYLLSLFITAYLLH